MSSVYCAYLRKSRADENVPIEETLARHEALLMETARRMSISITEFYREVVSGDSIAARPEMQRLLSDVEAGRWSGVLCVDITRLARGETIDQGIVAQAFKYSGTKIITPAKVYDPANEFDEEYFEFGLFMARREYKMITQRQQRGRHAAVKEGKWQANQAPYGYRRVKLQGEKGWTLEPDEHAPIVRDIFRWYVEDRLGTKRIADRLNDLGVPSPAGMRWLPEGIARVLDNPTYKGVVAWKRRPSIKARDKIKRPKGTNVEIYPGRHPALVDSETFDLAHAVRSQNYSAPGPKSVQMQNPLSGLLYCSECGAAMHRKIRYKDSPPALCCPNKQCATVSHNLADVEKAVADSLRVWLAGFTRDASYSKKDTETPALLRAITAQERELEKLSAQLDRAYELVEEGVYTSDVFLERSRKIAEKREAVEETISRLQEDVARRREIAASREQIAPTVTRVIDAYDYAQTAAEKNALLHTVLDKAIYKKTQKGAPFELDIFPLLPRI